MSRTCDVEGCEKRHHAQGLCAAHYKKKRCLPKCQVFACSDIEYRNRMCLSHWEKKERENESSPAQPIFDFPPFEYLPWMERALCLDKELLQYVANQIGYTGELADLFHPEQGHGKTVAKAAKAICSECPVMQECRDFAVPKTELSGIWGGLTEKERRAVRKAKGIVTKRPYVTDSKVRGLL